MLTQERGMRIIMIKSAFRIPHSSLAIAALSD